MSRPRMSFENARRTAEFSSRSTGTTGRPSLKLVFFLRKIRAISSREAGATLLLAWTTIFTGPLGTAATVTAALTPTPAASRTPRIRFEMRMVVSWLESKLHGELDQIRLGPQCPGRDAGGDRVFCRQREAVA